MAVMTVDVNDMVGVNAACLRLLSNGVGDEVAGAFIRGHAGNTDCGRPRLTASQIAAALERGNARAAANGEGRPGRDFTRERHEEPQKTFEEVTARITQTQAVMEGVERERPELTVGEQSVMAIKRAAALRAKV